MKNYDAIQKLEAQKEQVENEIKIIATAEKINFFNLEEKMEYRKRICIRIRELIMEGIDEEYKVLPIDELFPNKTGEFA